MFQMHINVLETRPAAEFGSYRPPSIAGDDSLQGRMLIRVSSADRIEQEQEQEQEHVFQSNQLEYNR